MVVHGRAFSPLFLILFLAVSFGTGLIFVTASQQSTEGRSKAFEVYDRCSTVCDPSGNSGINEAACAICRGPNGKIPSGTWCSMDAEPTAPQSCSRCQTGRDGAAFNPSTGRTECGASTTTTPPPLASPTTNPWDECMRWPAEHFGDDDYCLSTYREYKEAMDADWRCKQKWLFLNMCNDGEPPIELPNAPFPTGSPKP